MYGMTKEEAEAEAARINSIVGDGAVTVEPFEWGIAFKPKQDGFCMLFGCPVNITKGEMPGTFSINLDRQPDPFDMTSLRFETVKS